MRSKMSVQQIIDAKIEFTNTLLEKTREEGNEKLGVFCEGMRASLKNLKETLELAENGELTELEATTISFK